MINSKKAQASDFMTWTITTLVIVVLISLLIFFVNFSFLNDAKVSDYNSIRISDFVVGESLIAYAQTQDNGITFYKEIKNSGKSDEKKDNGKIAGLIFKNLYPEYSDAWFGVSYIVHARKIVSSIIGDKISGEKSVKPFDFTRPDSEVADPFGGVIYLDFVSVKLNLEKEKFLEFFGRKK